MKEFKRGVTKGIAVVPPETLTKKEWIDYIIMAHLFYKPATWDVLVEGFRLSDPAFNDFRMVRLRLQQLLNSKAIAFVDGRDNETYSKVDKE